MEYLNKLQGISKHFNIASKGLAKFGITYFSYGLISEGKVINTAFSNEDWEKCYKENHYENNDPLVQGVVNSNLPLIIWDALHVFGEERKVMSARNAICSVKSGMTIGIKSNNTTEIIALGAAITTQDFYILLSDERHFRNIHEIVKNFYSTHKKFLETDYNASPSLMNH